MRFDPIIFDRAANAIRPKLLYFLTKKENFSKETAEDLIQETLITAYQNWDKIHNEMVLDAWIFRIMKNLAANARRDQGRQKRGGDQHFTHFVEEIVNPAPDPEFRAHLKGLGKRALDCINRLSQPLFQCYVMRLINGENHEVIAKALKIKTGTVKSRISNAKNAVIQCIESIEEARGQ